MIRAAFALSAATAGGGWQAELKVRMLCLPWKFSSPAVVLVAAALSLGARCAWAAGQAGDIHQT